MSHVKSDDQTLNASLPSPKPKTKKCQRLTPEQQQLIIDSLNHFNGTLYPLAAKVCQSKIRVLSRLGYSHDDIESLCQYALVQSAIRYRPGYRASFVTYLTATISGMLTQELRMQQKQHRVCCTTYRDSESDDFFAIIEDKTLPPAHEIAHSLQLSQDIRHILEQAYQQISPGIREVIDLLYGISGEILSIEQVAERYQISETRVIRLRDVGLRMLANVLKSQKFSSETTRIRATMESTIPRRAYAAAIAERPDAIHPSRPKRHVSGPAL
jgi:RNA polymerase sigma factor (sigma-70 family)